MFWQLTLLPASFRGAAFRVQGYAAQGGRRLAKSEFPDRDDGYVEDLGRRLKQHRVRGYVVGEGYAGPRDALAAALDAPGPATLVHPYLGAITVACDGYTQTETLNEGGICVFEMNFVLAGQQPSPTSFIDTASALLAALDSMQAVLGGNFAALLPYLPTLASGGVVPLAGIAVDAIGAALGGLAASLGGALSGLGSAVIGTLQPQFAAAAATPSDPADTGAALLGAFFAAGAAAVAAANPVLAPYDPVVGYFGPAALPVDPSYGLAALMAWTPAAVPAAAGTTLGQTQTALTTLVQGAAVLAVATIYAQTQFSSANAAQAAGAELNAAIQAQAEAAANAGDDLLYLAWQAVATVAGQDVAARILALPLLGSYSVGASLPSVVLAQRLYQDASRADELVTLNGCIHPLFMPSSGVALSV